MSHDNPRAVILTALPVEFKAVRSFLDNLTERSHPQGNVYEQGTFSSDGKTWEIGIAEIGVGNPMAAMETERAIEFFQPQVILLVGIAGGIKGVKIGDVVAATKIYGYESGKAEAELFKLRPELGSGAYALVERAKAEARSEIWLKRLPSVPQPPPNAQAAPIAAGEKFIASATSDVCRFIKSNYSDAVAVEMEGYGFLQAAHANQQRASAIVVRGISNLIDSKRCSQKSESARQQKAALHASAFAFQILANFDPNTGLTGAQPSYAVQPESWQKLFDCFQSDDIEVIAPLCQQVFENRLTPIELDIYSELSQLNTLSALQEVFKRKDDLSIAVEWVGQVIKAFTQPDESQRSVPAALQTWYSYNKSSEPEIEPVKKPPGYLLIVLDPIDDRDQVAFTAELHLSNALPKELSEKGMKCSINEVGGFLAEAIWAAGDVKTIEIFLSWQHLNQPIHQWEVQVSRHFQGRRNRRSLWKIPQHTLVRSLDRLLAKELIDQWIEDMQDLWQRLPKAISEESQNICYSASTLDFERLDTDLLHKLVFKFLSALPEDEEDLQELLFLVVVSKVPVWLWSYSCPQDSVAFSTAIDSLLSAPNLTDSATFAQAICQQRATLPHLGVLCDCPTRLPVLVDLTNSPLRQPAAASS